MLRRRDADADTDTDTDTNPNPNTNPNADTDGYPDADTNREPDRLGAAVGSERGVHDGRPGHLQRRPLHVQAIAHLAGWVGTTERARTLVGQLTPANDHRRNHCRRTTTDTCFSRHRAAGRGEADRRPRRLPRPFLFDRRANLPGPGSGGRSLLTFYVLTQPSLAARRRSAEVATSFGAV